MRAGMFGGLAALVVLGVLAIAVTSAPAGNRSPEHSLLPVPGPSEVTFGENVAYSARLVNDGSSMFTHVTFAMQAPSTTVDGQTMYSPAPVYVSCDTDGVLEGWDGTTHTYTCPGFGQVPSDPNGLSPVRVTLVWQTPTVAAPEDLVCEAPTTSCTLVASSEWKIKESQPGDNDTFTDTAESTLLVQPDPKKAAGYAVHECTDPTTDPSVVTNADVGLGNKVATAVCATSVPASDLQSPGDAVFDPGLVIEIEESGTAALPPGLTSRITEASFICIPEPGSSCPATPGYGATGYDPWSFDDPDTPAIEKATFTFVIDNNQLPKGEKIDKVFHNGVLLPTPAGAAVTNIKVNNKLKITTVTVESPTQGGWDFG